MESTNSVSKPKYFSRNLLGILLVVFLSFSGSLRAAFLNWDDDTHLYKNEQIQPLTVPAVKKIFTSTVNDTYIPLTVLSFAVENQIFGLKPWIYHLDNILLHLGVVYLIYLLGGLLGLSEAASLFSALLFGLHPIHVESVSWVTERKDVLYAVFYVAALIFYLKYLQEKSWKFYFLV